MPVAQIDDNAGFETVTYLHTDHLMTNRLATDDAQQVIWRWEGEAFGNTEAQALGATTINLRFPGQYFDQETGFHYNWNRYYDPDTGRFIRSDPIGLEGGLSLYDYAGANSLRFSDPLGLFEVIRRGKDPQTFSDAFELGKKEALLRRYGELFQKKINNFCPEDRERLQKIFDRWRVFVDPNINNPAKRRRTTFADSKFADQTTQFNRRFFTMDMNDPGEFFTFAHEFRHLMPENDALFVPGDIGDLVIGKGSTLRGELDADAFAMKIILDN